MPASAAETASVSGYCIVGKTVDETGSGYDKTNQYFTFMAFNIVVHVSNQNRL